MTKIFSGLELQMSGNAARVISVDDYFLEEEEREIEDPDEPGGKQKVTVMEYNYDPDMLEVSPNLFLGRAFLSLEFFLFDPYPPVPSFLCSFLSRASSILSARSLLILPLLFFSRAPFSSSLRFLSTRSLLPLLLLFHNAC
jgi:hypothetical protein